MLERMHISAHGTVPHGDRQPHPAAHSQPEAFREAVDPGYWPRAIGLRVVIAICYAILVAGGLLAMSPLWFAISGGVLLTYSVAMAAIYLRWGLVRPYELLSPYVDTVVVTLAIVALAKPEYPIWMGYFLILPSLANFHSTKYVLAFAAWSIANCLAGFAIIDLAGRGEVSWFLATIIAFMAVFTGLNADIIGSSNRRLRAMVREASLTDPLTGLANRRMFREVLDAHAAPEVRPLAVLMYDVDNFKEINETRGHVEADTVLVAISDELRSCFRDADVVARYGGDEIIVLAHVDDVADASALAERSLSRVKETCAVTLSVGVAVYPITAPSLNLAVTAADDALGVAKRAGKARVALAA